MDIPDDDGQRFAAAKSALFIVAYYLISLGYFLGLKKSILKPEKVVPYLSFLADSSLEVFHLIPEKKLKFRQLIREVLQAEEVSVKTLQRLVGKCVSFSKAVPAAQLFTREMNAAISRGLRTSKPVRLCGGLREEVSHWLFLEEWDDPLPWRDERHSRVSIATDASNTGWGGGDPGLSVFPRGLRLLVTRGTVLGYLLEGSGCCRKSVVSFPGSSEKFLGGCERR